MIHKTSLAIVFILLGGPVLATSSETNSQLTPNCVDMMEKLNYELPNDLGALELCIPTHWVGGRADGLEALWIDNNAEGFKSNITLKIRDFDKVEDGEKLLDLFYEKMVEKSETESVSDSRSEAGTRYFSVSREVQGVALQQNTLLLFASNADKSADKSYVLTITHSHTTDDQGVDLQKQVMLQKQ